MSTSLKINRTLGLLPDMTRMEQSLYEKGYNMVSGVDEAGRGPLAGPVVAAAVIMPKGMKFEGLTDSKKLTAKRREELFDEIVASEAVCSIGVIDNFTIDKINILKASLMAMRKAVMTLCQKPEIVLIDGQHTIPNLDIPQFAIIGGDAICDCISAASVIAKVTRDRIMDKYQELYPEFSFSIHRGYPTPQHIRELKTFGPTEIHRKTFRPVEEIIKYIAIDIE
jgi:ribonuclease HII